MAGRRLMNIITRRGSRITIEFGSCVMAEMFSITGNPVGNAIGRVLTYSIWEPGSDVSRIIPTNGQCNIQIMESDIPSIWPGSMKRIDLSSIISSVR
jgi:hypothetical protein